MGCDSDSMPGETSVVDEEEKRGGSGRYAFIWRAFVDFLRRCDPGAVRNDRCRSLSCGAAHHFTCCTADVQPPEQIGGEAGC